MVYEINNNVRYDNLLLCYCIDLNVNVNLNKENVCTLIAFIKYNFSIKSIYSKENVQYDINIGHTIRGV